MYFGNYDTVNIIYVNSHYFELNEVWRTVWTKDLCNWYRSRGNIEFWHFYWIYRVFYFFHLLSFYTQIARCNVVSSVLVYTNNCG